MGTYDPECVIALLSIKHPREVRPAACTLCARWNASAGGWWNHSPHLDSMTASSSHTGSGPCARLGSPMGVHGVRKGTHQRRSKNGRDRRRASPAWQTPCSSCSPRALAGSGFCSPAVIFRAAPQDDGLMPLHVAAGGGHAEVVSVLISAGADASAAGADRFTPLHFAANHGSAECVKLLLAHPGQNPEARATVRRPARQAQLNLFGVPVGVC